MKQIIFIIAFAPYILLGQGLSQRIESITNQLDDIFIDVQKLESDLPCNDGVSDVSLFHYNNYKDQFGADLYFNPELARNHRKGYIPTISLQYDARTHRLIAVHFSGVDEGSVNTQDYDEGFMLATYNTSVYYFDKWGNRRVPYSIWIKDPTK